MRIRYPVENGEALQAVQSFLKHILSSGMVDLLLVPMRTPSGTITPALVSSPELLSAADPLAPVLPVNAATLASQVSARKPRPRVGAVLRSCEIRALVELVKLQQASLEDLLLIAVDCAGAYPVSVYGRKAAAGNHLAMDLFAAAVQSPDAPPDDLRQACKICEQPVYEGALITLEFLSSSLDQEILISLPDELAGQLGLPAAEDGQRPQVVQKLVNARTAARDAAFSAIRERMEGGEDITKIFAACIRCHNCMTVCPICYCKTCVFKSPIFDHEPMQYLGWARQKGAFRMPADSMLFHLTRLNHMSLSCIGCGMCTEACPAELPVGTVFRAIGQRVQAAFDYQPGRSIDEKPPLITFKADEWTEVGE